MSERERPEYIKCVRQMHKDREKQSWCGRSLMQEWAFVDIDHAAYSQLNGDYLLICPECLAKIIESLKWQEETQ